MFFKKVTFLKEKQLGVLKLQSSHYSYKKKGYRFETLLLQSRGIRRVWCRMDKLIIDVILL